MIVDPELGLVDAEESWLLELVPLEVLGDVGLVVLWLAEEL